MTDLEKNISVKDNCVYISAKVYADSLIGDIRF